MVNMDPFMRRYRSPEEVPNDDDDDEHDEKEEEKSKKLDDTTDGRSDFAHIHVNGTNGTYAYVSKQTDYVQRVDPLSETSRLSCVPPYVYFALVEKETAKKSERTTEHESEHEPDHVVDPDESESRAKPKKGAMPRHQLYRSHPQHSDYLQREIMRAKVTVLTPTWRYAKRPKAVWRLLILAVLRDEHFKGRIAELQRDLALQPSLEATAMCEDASLEDALAAFTDTEAHFNDTVEQLYEYALFVTTLFLPYTSGADLNGNNDDDDNSDVVGTAWTWRCEPIELPLKTRRLQVVARYCAWISSIEGALTWIKSYDDADASGTTTPPLTSPSNPGSRAAALDPRITYDCKNRPKMTNSLRTALDDELDRLEEREGSQTFIKSTDEPVPVSCRGAIDPLWHCNLSTTFDIGDYVCLSAAAAKAGVAACPPNEFCIVVDNKPARTGSVVVRFASKSRLQTLSLPKASLVKLDDDAWQRHKDTRVFTAIVASNFHKCYGKPGGKAGCFVSPTANFFYTTTTRTTIISF